LPCLFPFKIAETSSMLPVDVVEDDVELALLFDDWLPFEV
jgi:hypothetical protein